MPTETVTDYHIKIDARLIERFIVEVDGIATFDSIMHGRRETWLEQHI